MSSSSLNRPLKVLGVTGSLRANSNSSLLLEAASRELPDGAELLPWNGLDALPHYNQDVDDAGEPPTVAALRRAIAAADAVLFVTPEYNGTIPGVLKNAVDWASRPRGTAALLGKPVAAISSSPGRFGGVWAQADLRRSLGLAGARALDIEFAVPNAAEAFTEHGELSDDAARAALRELLEMLVAETRQTLAAAA